MDAEANRITEMLEAEGIAPDVVENESGEVQEENQGSEETKETSEEVLTEDVSEATAEDSSVEGLAAQYGWNDKGEKSAEEYIRVAMEKFPDQSKKIKQLFRTVDEMKVHMDKVNKSAYERAKNELEAERALAIEEGDSERVEELNQAREELKEPVVLHPAVVEFKDKHADWIEGTSYEDVQMQEWLFKRDNLIGGKNLPPEEHMKLLEDHLVKEFPDKFQKSSVASPVASGSDNVVQSKGTRKGKPTFNDLSSEQKRVARDFERMDVMSVDNYIQDLIKNGELK